MEKRVETWGQGSGNGLREDGSGDRALTSLNYRWEGMRASLACGKYIPQYFLHLSAKVVF